MRRAWRRPGSRVGGEFDVALRIPLEVTVENLLQTPPSPVTVGELLTSRLTVVAVEPLDESRSHQWLSRLAAASPRLRRRGISVVVVQAAGVSTPRWGGIGAGSVAVFADPAGGVAAAVGAAGVEVPVVVAVDRYGNVCWRQLGRLDGRHPPVRAVEAAATMLAKMTS